MLVGKLRNRLLDAAKEYPHVKVLVVSEAFTTRTCGKCGVHNSTVGGAEVFKCRQRGCGYVCFRDLHAARIFLSSVSLSFWSVHFIADWCHQSLILPSVDALCYLVGTADPNPSPALPRRGVRRAVTGPGRHRNPPFLSLLLSQSLSQRHSLTHSFISCSLCSVRCLFDGHSIPDCRRTRSVLRIRSIASTSSAAGRVRYHDISLPFATPPSGPCF
jgi:hypothetical protein